MVLGFFCCLFVFAHSLVVSPLWLAAQKSQLPPPSILYPVVQELLGKKKNKTSKQYPHQKKYPPNTTLISTTNELEIYKGGKRIRILYERKEEYEVINEKKNDFKRDGGEEIIRVGNRNNGKKRENKIYYINKIGKE